MTAGSPSAYLLWAVLSCIFQCFLVLHLWLYDRFNCLRWDSGRQPGAFKRVMTYSYLSTLPLLVCFSVAMTTFKFREGFILAQDGRTVLPRPFTDWSPENKRYLLPLFFTLSVAWSLEIVTHLEELTFWLFLLHQGPGKRDWFHSWEFRTWYIGSLLAILGLPVTTIITRHQVNTGLPWIFLVGSFAGFLTTICFLYVLLRFPAFLQYVKAAGADPDVVVRLRTFYELNCIRVAFRFCFTIPLLIIGFDGVKDPFPILQNQFVVESLLMVGGIGCFISSGITLLVFFPRSVAQESGYRARIISPQASKPAAEPYYHDHVGHDRGASNPMSVLGYPSRPTSGMRRDYRFPADDPNHPRPPLPDDASHPLPRASSDCGEQSSLGYDSDAESVAMSSHSIKTMQGARGSHSKQRLAHQPDHHPIQQSMSQPPRSRGSGTKSDDTVWGEEPHLVNASLPSLRRHSDGPFVYHQNGKTLSRAPSHADEPPTHEDQLHSSRRSSHLHPYVLNFTSPIDLMDGRDDDRVSLA